MIRSCCRCHRVEAAGLWGPGPIEGASERVSHGLCPDCYTTVMAEIEAYISEKSLRALALTSWEPIQGVCDPCV